MGSLSSMIDIVFLLIIFFIVTASYDDIEMDDSVLLPTIANQSISQALPADRLMINVRESGALRIGFTTIPPGEITQKLRHTIRSRTPSPDTVVIINGDKRTKHRHIRKVLDELAILGYLNVQIHTLLEDFSEEVTQ